MPVHVERNFPDKGQEARCRESKPGKFGIEPGQIGIWQMGWWGRWGFGGVDKSRCVRSARRFGAVQVQAGTFPGFFHGMAASDSRPLSRNLFPCRLYILLSYTGQPFFNLFLSMLVCTWASGMRLHGSYTLPRTRAPSPPVPDAGYVVCRSRWFCGILLSKILFIDWSWWSQLRCTAPWNTFGHNN